MKTIFLTIVAAAILFVAAAGCGTTEPHPGIEAGNPDLDTETTKIRVVPEEGNELYEVVLLDETRASVSRIVSDGTETESVIVFYSQDDQTVNLQASFSDRQTITLEATIDKSEGTVSGTLKVNGEEVESCFEMPEITRACEENDSGAVQTDTETQEPSTDSTADDSGTGALEESGSTADTEEAAVPPAQPLRIPDPSSSTYTDYDSELNPDNTSDPPPPPSPDSPEGPAFTTPDWQIEPYKINDPTL